MTCVSPTARITPGCTGMWNDDHVAAWQRIVDFVHANSQGEDSASSSAIPAPRARPSSAGRKWTRRSPTGNWPVMAASDVPWSPANQIAPRR